MLLIISISSSVLLQSLQNSGSHDINEKIGFEWINWLRHKCETDGVVQRLKTSEVDSYFWVSCKLKPNTLSETDSHADL